MLAAEEKRRFPLKRLPTPQRPSYLHRFHMAFPRAFQRLYAALRCEKPLRLHCETVARHCRTITEVQRCAHSVQQMCSTAIWAPLTPRTMLCPNMASTM